MLVNSPLTQIALRLPPISLPDLTGEQVQLAEYADSRPILVVFAANHCPYVVHLEKALGQFALDHRSANLAIVAISSNNVEAYPDDDVAGLRSQVQRAGWDFPYLVDAEQIAARTFGAVCTPDFFLFDSTGDLVYRGAFDFSSPGNSEPNDGSLLREAAAALLADRPVPAARKSAMGCSIKWKT